VIDWSERIAKDRTEFSANLGFYGKTTGTPVSVVEVRGGGGTGTEAVMDALGCLAAEVLGSPADSTPDLELQRLSINGAGKKMRLYAEIAAGGRSYAAERAGETGAGGLLFLCGLDVINAELLRRIVADDNGGKNEQAGIIVEDFSQ
jgi:hypothetical protein